jgi:Phage integrase family.
MESEISLFQEKKPKRGVENINEYVEPFTFIEQIETANHHEYTVDAETKIRRDKALVAFLGLTGMRISEALNIDCSQVKLNDDPQYIVVKDVKILKRRKTVKNEFVLPKTGILQPLTEMVLAHLDNRKESPLFDLSRYWAWKIVKRMTGKWCHYFRSQRISFLVNEKRLPPTAICKMMGMKDLKTVLHYDKSAWQDFRNELF